jgi:hypothetical protein
MELNEHIHNQQVKINEHIIIQHQKNEELSKSKVSQIG